MDDDNNSYNIRLLLKLDGLLTSWGNATSEAAYLDKACKEAKQVNGWETKQINLFDWCKIGNNEIAI